MNREQLFDRFYFDDNAGFDQEIDTQTVAKVKPIVIERDGRLPGNLKTAPFEFSREHHYVHGLQ
jgi:hypothetical protein